MNYRRSELKSVSHRKKDSIREQKCRDCGKAVTFRFFRSYTRDANGRPVHVWRCAFDADKPNSRYKHICNPADIKQHKRETSKQQEVATPNV